MSFRSNIDLIIDENQRSFIQKYNGIQHTHPFEDIGRIFHELVLIPSLFFFADSIALIHGSALETKNNDSIIIGGAGGVGKTSLELFLIFNKNLKFLADDIVIVDKDKFVWPNYAYPKIYGYNTKENKDLEKKVLQKRGVLDKAQWLFKKSLTGRPVRRRVNPKIFYNGSISNGSKLSDYFILFRGDYKDFEILIQVPKKVKQD